MTGSATPVLLDSSLRRFRLRFDPDEPVDDGDSDGDDDEEEDEDEDKDGDNEGT